MNIETFNNQMNKINRKQEKAEQKVKVENLDGSIEQLHTNLNEFQQERFITHLSGLFNNPTKIKEALIEDEISEIKITQNDFNYKSLRQVVKNQNQVKLHRIDFLNFLKQNKQYVIQEIAKAANNEAHLNKKITNFINNISKQLNEQ